MPSILSVNQPLYQRSRMAGSVAVGPSVGLGELAILIGCGLGAVAMSALVDFGVRVPGHGILRAVLPLSLGLALVPRRGAGVTMGASAALGVVGIWLAGLKGIGPGATTSLLLLGPMLDVALRRARPGWRLYAAFAVAGLIANLGAFMVRGGAKMAGGAWAGLRPLHDWLSVAPWSYAACGLLAGLVSGAIWFRAGDSASTRAPGGPVP